MCRVRLYTDTAGASKGHGTVEFDHPVEAVQAISMFREQNLYGRPMSIRMDKYDVDDMQDELPNVLPAGLEGVGKGLGVNGQPLNVGKSLFNGSIAPLNSVNNLSITPSYASPPGTTYCSSYVSPYGPVGGFGTDMCSTPYPAAAAPVQAYSGQMSHSTVNNPIAPMTNMNTAVNANPDGSSNNSAFNSAAASSMTTSGSSYPHSSNLSTIPQQVNPSLYGSNFEREFREEKYRPVQAMSSVTGVPPPAISPMNGVPQLTETVLVRNFPPTYTWQNVRDRFSEIGGVRFAELKGRGTAIVRFASDRDAQRAVHMLNGARIDGRSIEVSLYY